MDGRDKTLFANTFAGGKKRLTSQSCYVFNASSILAQGTQHEGYETLYYSSAHGTAFAPFSGTDTRVKTQTTLATMQEMLY